MSTAWITDRRGAPVPYTMIVQRRSRQGKEGRPEDAYVAFAVSGLDVRIKRGHLRRWGIETGHRMLKRSIISAPGRDEAARTPCFVLSPAAHNARAVACADSQAGLRGGWLSQAMLRLAPVRAATDSMGPGPEPPPPV